MNCLYRTKEDCRQLRTNELSTFIVCTEGDEEQWDMEILGRVRVSFRVQFLLCAPAGGVVAADAIEECERVQRLREGGPSAVLGLLLGAVVGEATVTPGADDQLAACHNLLNKIKTNE